jgi:branched-chain amino acid transport system permease protein
VDFANLSRSFWALTVDGLTSGSIYALIALGYTLVYGVMRLINFAHSEVFMVGTFAALFAANAIGVSQPPGLLAFAGLLLVLLLAAMAASGGTAVLLERIAYRPLRKRGAGRLAALISAIGASLFLQELFALRYGRNNLAFPRILEKEELFTFWGASVRSDKVLVFVAALVMLVLLDRFVNATRLGRGIRAAAQDAETAVLMGVNIDRVIMVTFLLGGVMAGAAAVLYMTFFEITNYFAGFVLGIKAFTAAVLGGIGNLRGALVGGLALGLFENYGAALVGSQWKDVVAFLVLVAVLMLRPTGILGETLTRARV